MHTTLAAKIVFENYPGIFMAIINRSPANIAAVVAEI
jgi:hypothetical protein